MEKNIDIDVVTFQQAIDLCVLGFNDKTLCAYEIENQELYLCHLDEQGLYMPEKDIPAPFNSQVFRWFREKYDLFGIVHRLEHMEEYYYMWVIEGICYSSDWQTYEEAENACIDQLILIGKQQSNTDDTLSKQ